MLGACLLFPGHLSLTAPVQCGVFVRACVCDCLHTLYVGLRSIASVAPAHHLPIPKPLTRSLPPWGACTDQNKVQKWKGVVDVGSCCRNEFNDGAVSVCASTSTHRTKKGELFHLPLLKTTWDWKVSYSWLNNDLLSYRLQVSNSPLLFPLLLSACGFIVLQLR